MGLRAIDPRYDERQEMLDRLAEIHVRIERSETCTLVAVEAPSRADDPILLHAVGEVSYSRVIGLLEIAKMDIYRRATFE